MYDSNLHTKMIFVDILNPIESFGRTVGTRLYPHSPWKFSMGFQKNNLRVDSSLCGDD